MNNLFVIMYNFIGFNKMSNTMVIVPCDVCVSRDLDCAPEGEHILSFF